MRNLSLVFWLTLALLPWTSAHAYIGPGVGASTIAVVLGILGSIFFAFVGILWYPIKRLLKGRKTYPRTPGESDPLTENTTSRGNLD